MDLIEVKDRFLKDESKQAELEVFLSAQDSQQTEPEVIVYGPSIDFVGAVRVRFSKAGKMKSIQCHAGSANRLEQKIDDAIYKDHGKTVGRRFIFTNIKIAEQYRLNDEFQIIPAPPGSPEVDTLLGDHPAILEYSYCKSTHRLIDSHRRSERADELSYMLSAFVFGGIEWINNHADKYWVLERPEGTELTSEYRQELYICGDWEQKDGIGFSVLDEIPEMPLMASTAYYGQLGIGFDSAFHLPTEIGTYFNKYEALLAEEKEMARLSAHWLQKSSVVFSASVSLSFSAIAFALESLIHTPQRKGECKACGQAIYEKSISQCFRDLVETHAKGIPKKDVNDIYAVRSKIAHGSGLMAHDQNVGFRFSDPLMKSQSLYRTARYFCQVVFLNWLMSRD